MHGILRKEIKFSTAVLWSSLAFVFFFIIPLHFAAASVLYTGTTDSHILGTTGSTYGWFQEDGAAFSGKTISTITINEMYNDSAGNTYITIIGYDATTSPSFSNVCTSDTNSHDFSTGGYQSGTWTFTTPCNMPTGTKVVIATFNGNGQAYYGYKTAGYTGPAGETKALSGEIDGSGGTPLNVNTRFDSFTPTLGTTTPNATSTSFTIGATGYINPSDFATSSTRVHVRFRQTTGIGVGTNSILSTGADIYFDATTTGAFSFSTTTSITNTGVYTVYWAIEHPRFSLFGIGFLTDTVLSALGDFVVSSAANPVSQQQLDQATVAGQFGPIGYTGQQLPIDDASASSTLLGLGGAFNIANVVLNKFPINWVVQYANVLSDLASSTATTTIPAVVINYGGLKEIQNIPTTTAQTLQFTFFSAATFDQVAALPGISAMRMLLGWTLWIGLIFYAWRRVSGIFTQAQK